MVVLLLLQLVDMSQLPYVSEEFRTRLGKVVIPFAILEGALAASIDTLLESSSNRSFIVTAVLPFSTKLQVYRALAMDRATGDEALIQEIAELCTRIQQTGEDRNLYIHSLWLSLPDAPFRISEKLGAVKTGPVSASALLTFAAGTEGTTLLLDAQVAKLTPTEAKDVRVYPSSTTATSQTSDPTTATAATSQNPVVPTPVVAEGLVKIDLASVPEGGRFMWSGFGTEEVWVEVVSREEFLAEWKKPPLTGRGYVQYLPAPRKPIDPPADASCWVFDPSKDVRL